MAGGEDLRPDVVGAEVGRAQHLAVEAVLLGELRLAGLAGRDVEPAVGAEGDPAAVVDRAGLDAVTTTPSKVSRPRARRKRPTRFSAGVVKYR